MGNNKYIFIVLTLTLLITLTRVNEPVTAAGIVPGTIQAESYDAMSGVQIEACSEGTQNVSWIDAGDWMDYNVTVQTTGAYTVNFRVASPYADTRLQLKNGAAVLATVTIPNTGGYQAWATISANINLTTGSQIIRVHAVTNGWNLNWMSFTLNSTATPTPTRAATPTPISTPTPTPGGDVLAVIVSATASSAIQGAGYSYDRDTGTRWESIHGADPQWIYWDLGSNKSLSKISVEWEVAGAASYAIQGSTDSSNWTNLATVSNSSTADHNKITTTINGSYRYVRMYGTSRTTPYGYSIWETSIYVFGGATATPSPTGAVITVPIIIPYMQYQEIVLNPADNNGTSLIKTQNTSQTVNVDYNNGAAMTLRSQGGVGQTIRFSAQDSSGGTHQGDPLTMTVYSGLTINVIVVSGTPTPTPTGDAVNLALNKTATASSTQAGLPADLAVDGNTITRWGSDASDPQWFRVDLGSIQTIKRVILRWETAYAKSYVIQTSNDAASWSNIYATSSGPGGTEDLNVSGSGRYIRMYGTERGTVWGYSLWELEVYNVAAPTPPPTATPSPSPVSDFNTAAPVNGAMITNSRRPTLSWNAVSGATSYQVWLNISRTDYNWYESGNLLDRFTQMATVTTNSYTLAQDLPDRWTYKWYIIAVGSGGNKRSNTATFSVYLPALETADDGINIVNGCRDMNKNGTIEPFEDWHLSIQNRLDDLMTRLTNEEKFRQCFYGAESDNPLNGFSFSYGVEGGMTTTQYNCAKTRMGIPTAFAGDKIHGWKTIYPTQLGLAATRDMNIAYQCGNLQRVEQKSFGFTGMLMPLAEVDTKVLYPRFQEGCGENADEAAALLRAFICGLQGGPEPNPHSLMTTVKHWPSQGVGGEGPLQYDAVTIKYHMKPWFAAIDANPVSVMPGYSSSPYLDPSGAGANESKPTIDYLRNVIGFKGFIVTDWLGASSDQTIRSMKAGIDVMGGATSSGSDLNTVLAGIGQARLDDAARHILEMKLRLGMFENPYGDPACTWNALNNHNIALNAAQKSITLLKNNGILPLRLVSGDNMIVGGPRATWIINDYDPNVIWQSIFYSDPYAVNYVKAFQNKMSSKGVNVYQDAAFNAKVAIVVIGEQSYTHATEWPNRSPNIPADQLAVIQNFKAQGVPVVTVVISPRPYVLTDVANLSDALMLVYRGGTAIGEAVAGLCIGDYTPTGKLPFQLPRSTAQIGTDEVANQLEKWELPYDLGATDAQRAEIRNYIYNNQTVPTNYGDPLYPYGAGLQSF